MDENLVSLCFGIKNKTLKIVRKFRNLLYLEYTFFGKFPQFGLHKSSKGFKWHAMRPPKIFVNKDVGLDSCVIDGPGVAGTVLQTVSLLGPSITHDLPIFFLFLNAIMPNWLELSIQPKIRVTLTYVV